MDEEDTYQTLAGQVLDPFIEQGKRVVDWSGRVFEGRSQELQGVPAAQRNEEVRPIGTSAVLNGRPVRWAGQNYGWQSDASYTQLEQLGQFRFGQITGDRIMTDVGQAVGDIIENIPEPVKQTAVDVAKTGLTAAADVYASLPLYQQQNIATGVEFVAGTARAINGYMERFSETTNTSRYITDELFMAGTGKAAQAVKPVAKQAATTAVKKVVKAADDIFPPTSGGGGLAYATVGGVPTNVPEPKLKIENGVAKLTLKDPENIPAGITKGSARSPEFAVQVQEYNQRRAAMKERLQSAASDKKRRQYREEAYNEMSTGPSRDPQANPEAYGSRKTFQQFKEQSQVDPLTKMGNTNWKQQHHLFPKQESYQFVERMVELGDDDDVLALFIMAEDMDATLGGRLKNMLNMEDRPHSVLHSSRIKDGRQLKSIEMANLVENAKSTDELMRLFRQYITDNVLPSKDEAIAISKIGDRLLEMKKYRYLDELYDKNLIRKPVL
jgi:hypothetical protein